MARKERYLVGLDVGTSKVTAVVGEMLDGGGLDIVGLGVAESRGIRRGVVVNLEAAVESIKKAIDEAELMAGVEIDSVHLALSGPHIKGFNSRGVIAVAGKNREITREDVRRAIDAAKAVSLPTGREILHVLPQDFVVDEQDGIGAPVGMTGARLEVNVHIITGSQSSTQNIVACVNRAGVNVAETVVEQLAASESVLTEDEKELGVALVDIGGGTTDIAIYERGSLWHTAVVGVGGDHFTNDIAVGLRTPVPDAEKIKRKCGCALSGMVDEDETMEVASVGGRKPRVMARRILSEILQPRAEEIFHLVWDEIRRAGYEKSLNSGIVLTGGGAILDGMPEIAEQIFDLPIRRGCPTGVGGLADHVNSPTFATGVGLVLYGYRNSVGERGARAGRRGRAGARGRAAARVVQGVLLITGSLRVRRHARTDGPHSEGATMADFDDAHDAEDARTRLRLRLDEEVSAGRPHQGDRRRRRRQQRRQPHGARRASTASSSSSPTPTCRRCSSNAAPVKLQIGVEADQGARRRRRPERRPSAALEDTDKIIQALDGADMIFVTTGLGGGTGTGAAPVIASLASELGALTVAVVTKPFKFEGKKRQLQAERGLEALRDCVDTIITIPNERLLDDHRPLDAADRRVRARPTMCCGRRFRAFRT